MLALVNKNPYEAWAGKRTPLSHLSVFGCDSFVHIPKERRKKLENKFDKCIFIGHKDGIMGYKLWSPITRTTVYIRDVIFREDKITSKNEEVKRESELEKLEFNWNNESHGLDGSTESEEEAELQPPVIRIFGRVSKQLERYIPTKFGLTFLLYTIEDDPRTIKEAIDST